MEKRPVFLTKTICQSPRIFRLIFFVQKYSVCVSKSARACSCTAMSRHLMQCKSWSPCVKKKKKTFQQNRLRPQLHSSACSTFVSNYAIITFLNAQNKPGIDEGNMEVLIAHMTLSVTCSTRKYIAIFQALSKGAATYRLFSHQKSI